MSGKTDPEFEAWIQRARDADVVQIAESVLHVKLRRAGRDHHASCPKCGGKDNNEFVLTPGNEQNKQFLCRKSSEGGDVISMVRHVLDLEFVAACETILGEPPPRADRSAPARPVDHEAERMLADRQRDDEIVRKGAEQRALERKISRAQQVFDAAQDISGTQAARYLKARGLVLLEEQRRFIRFIPSHPYYHGEDADKNPIKVGVWPAMVSLMRDADGNGTSLHCTYLDPVEPRKLKHQITTQEGKEIWLNPRKMYGQKGLIWLSPIRPFMVIGEGIETTLSWYELHTQYADIGIAAAGDLGNISGASTSTIPHPRLAKRTVQNGVPNPERPGMPVPAAVQEIILLGDSDTDEANVRAHLLTACRRHIAAGRKVSVHMATKPPGERKWDWNDELMRSLSIGAA